MFKKLLLMGAAVALVLAGVSSAQAAGIALTAHDLAATGGACAACHLPHGAQGARLWVAPPAIGASNVRGAVAPLCGYCHHEQGGQKGFGTDATSTTWVFGTLSHGFMISTGDLPNTLLFSELPYHKTGMSLGNIECTTCHDVHNNDAGKNPFLRRSMSVLCATCHGARQWNGTAWQQGAVATIGTLVNWNTNGTNSDEGLANPGSHPVGLDVTGDGNARAPIMIWRSMKVGFAASRMKWSLGGHLNNGNTGGVTCATCHAVHGLKADIATGNGTAPGANAADDTAANINMLAIAQLGNMQDGTRSIANGHGVTALANGGNPLCQGCHVTLAANAGAMNTAYGVAIATTGNILASAIINPNPGATAYGHPVDEMRVLQGANWVPNGTVWPTLNLNWPVGYATAASASNPNVICESCHVAHPAANAGRIDLVTTPAQAYSNEYILRTQAKDVCGACHSSSLKRHHPVGRTFNTGGITYLQATAGAARLASLECGTCHGGGAGAHNWPGRAQVGLDAGWRPTNNGRLDGTQATQLFNTVASLSCLDCHAGMVNGTPKANRSPTLHAVLNTQYSGPLGLTGEAFNTIGYGSHVLGRFSATATAGNFIRLNKTSAAAYWGSMYGRLPGGTNLFTTGNVWPAAYFGGNGGWSVFGGNVDNPVLVCESCHELQPTKNSTTHLLLGAYIEEGYNVARPALAESRSRFCEGCHTPLGTHQMTSQTVSKTNAVLNTDTADLTNRPWLVPPTETVNLKLSNNNMMNCDTCHQPHDAATNSTTFILDVANSYVGTMNGLRAAGAGVWGSYSGFWPTIQNARGGDHSRFCQQCHKY